MAHKKPPRIHAFRVFFPAACVYAALAVPLSVYAMTSGSAWPPGLTVGGHARELLFGFALALVAGYTLGPIQRGSLAGLFILWSGARLAWPLWPGHPLVELLNAGFVLWLAARIVPRFLSARKWRNRIVSPLLLALCLLPVGHTIVMYAGGYATTYTLRLEAVLLFALLMAFIGGRIIAPAAAGESERRGLRLESRVQPHLEATIIVSLAASALLLPLAALNSAAGAGCIVAGTVVLARLTRWRLWRCVHRPDLIGLGIGYAWLGGGLIVLGTAIVSGTAKIAAVHLITVGALGGLSTGVMARLHNQHRFRRPPPIVVVIPAVILISAATVFRVAATYVQPDAIWPLWTAAACWSGAYLLLALHLTAGRPHAAKPHKS